MAERRMFAMTIIDSDAFLDMPLSTQCLYFHLSMRADDEGFINSPKKIQRMIGASDDDLKVLIAKKFIIPFKSGVVVIKHWKIHNYIRKDRLVETVYQEEKQQLSEKENGSYTFKKAEVLMLNEEKMCCQSSDGQVTDKCHHRLGKDSIGKYSIGKDSIDIYGQNFDQPPNNDVEIFEDWQIKFKDFYEKYPKKVKKQDVEKWFNKNKPSNELFSSMMNSLEQFRASKDWQKDGGQFIPYPSTWLNQKRWEDEDIQSNKPMSALQRAWQKGENNG